MPLPPAQIERLAQALAQRWPSPPADAARERVAARVVDAQLEPGGLCRLRLQTERPLKHALPGQYTTLQLDQLAPRFLALASAPHEPYQVLISARTTLGRALRLGLEDELGQGSPADHAQLRARLDALSRGEHPALTLSLAEGPGYPDALWTREQGPLLAFATGSGVATVRALLAHLAHIAPERLAQTTLYYGERAAQDHAYRQELVALSALGLSVVLVSEDSPTGPFVQDAFARDPWPLEDAHVVLSGAPIMTERVAAMVLGRGLAPEHIHLNVAAPKRS